MQYTESELQMKYFTIHSLHAMENGNYSNIRTNVENTHNKRVLASKLYPSDLYYFEFHECKKDIKVVYTK